MAIVKMKKLRLLAIKSQRDELLRRLQLLGCVQVAEPEKTEGPVALSRESGPAAEYREAHRELVNALGLLDKYASVKDGLFAQRPEVRCSALMDDSGEENQLALARKIIELDDKIKRLNAREMDQRNAMEALAPWLEMDLPLDYKGTKNTGALFGSLPAAVELSAMKSEIGEKCPCSEIYEISGDKEQHCILVLFHISEREEITEQLRTFWFSPMALAGTPGTARENTEKAQKELEELRTQRESLAAAIAAEKPHRDELKLAVDHMSARIEQAEAVSSLQSTQSTIVLEGWVPAEAEKALAEALDSFDCAWETADPDPDKLDEIPIKLKNNKLTEPYNVVTEMYSLPAYNGLDPNPFLMPFFALFFGIMFADMAYGLIMFAAGLIVLKKAKPTGTMKNMMGMLVQCGISTFVIGFLTGGFFGDAVTVVARIFGKEVTLIPTFASIHIGEIAIDLPLNLLEGNNPLYVLILAMCLGAVHLAVGVGLGCYLKARDKDWLGILQDLSWWVIFAGIGVMAVTGNTWLLYFGIAVMVLGAFLGGKGIGRLTAVFSTVYNGATGYLGDILSYSRLMALMLAGSVIASVFNQLGSLGGILLFIPVAIIGHTLNFALNLIGCFVHTMRLQYLEFFGKWYRDGGRPFRPLSIKTKYVNIIKED